MKSIAISNREELRSEITRLTILEDEQRIALGQRFRSPSAVFAAALTIFPKSGAARSVTDHGLSSGDILSMASRFLIPLTLNKTLFRHSGVLVKLMVGLMSQKAAGFVTEGKIENLFAQGKSFVEKLFSSKATPENPELIVKPTI